MLFLMLADQDGESGLLKICGQLGLEYGALKCSAADGEVLYQKEFNYINK